MLAPKPRVLVPTKRRPQHGPMVVIHKHHTDIHTSSNTEAALAVMTEYATRQSEARLVYDFDGVVFGVEGADGYDGAEHFFLRYLHVGRYIGNQSWGYEETVFKSLVGW